MALDPPSLQNSNYAVNHSHRPHFQTSDFASSESFQPSTVVSSFQAKCQTCICGSFHSVVQLILVLSAISLRVGRIAQMVSLRHAYSDIWTECFPVSHHGCTSDPFPTDSCVGHSMWHLVVLGIPRNCTTAISMIPFVCLSLPVTSALYSFKDSISESEDGWHRVALHCNIVEVKEVGELHNPLDCPKHLNALLQNDTAHDVFNACSHSLQCMSLTLLQLTDCLLLNFVSCSRLLALLDGLHFEGSSSAHHAVCAPVSEPYASCFVFLSPSGLGCCTAQLSL